jgi:hypothetical protein
MAETRKLASILVSDVVGTADLLARRKVLPIMPAGEVIE